MHTHWSFVWARSSASMSIPTKFTISSFVAAVGGAASFPSNSDLAALNPPPPTFLAAIFIASTSSCAWRIRRERSEAKTPFPLYCALASSCVYSYSNSSQSPISAFCNLLRKHFWSSKYLVVISSTSTSSSSAAPPRRRCAIGTKAMRPFSTQSHRPAAAAACPLALRQRHAGQSHPTAR